jgi:hypothetical protein
LEYNLRIRQPPSIVHDDKSVKGYVQLLKDEVTACQRFTLNSTKQMIEPWVYFCWNGLWELFWHGTRRHPQIDVLRWYCFTEELDSNVLRDISQENAPLLSWLSHSYFQWSCKGCVWQSNIRLGYELEFEVLPSSEDTNSRLVFFHCCFDMNEGSLVGWEG